MNFPKIPARHRFTPVWIILSVQLAMLALTIPSFLNPLYHGVLMVIGPVFCLALFLVWFFVWSGLRLSEAFLVLSVTVGLFGVSLLFLHGSVWPAFWIYGVPAAMMAMTASLWLSKNKPKRRLPILVFGLAPLFLILSLFRLDGFTGGFTPEWSFRWTRPSAEQALEVVAAEVVSARNEEDWSAIIGEWPAFRGPDRNGRVSGIAGKLNWKDASPTEIWRMPIGTGWSSFSLASGRLFTQEQRGDQEWVSCYAAENAALIWRYENQVRFTETVSGAGPRGTPTYAAGRIFAMGSKGLLSALDAESGKILWRHDLTTEVEASIPMWGFSGSPLVVDDLVLVYAGGSGDNGLIAYNVVDGERVWRFAVEGDSYSSPQLVSLDKTRMVLFGDINGFHALDPRTGKKIWSYKPTEASSAAIVQPQIIGANDLIVPIGEGIGLARLKITRSGQDWQIKEVWSSNALKPAFNDFVFHDGYLYGFDKNIFACVNAETGERQWKRGRYGFGQAVLLRDGGQILVVSEKGELILLEADPNEFVESGRLPIIKGKTWNHPIVVNGRVYLRNGAEAVCLEL